MAAPLHLATFRCDVTPPIGHPLCGGLVQAARGVDDPLWALGVVLLGRGKPMVLCAVDWCGLSNEAYLTWRKALAEAAHTTPEHVAIQCLHPHDAPFADVVVQKISEKARGPAMLDLKFFAKVVEQSADALRKGLEKTMRVNRVGMGEAKVEKVASNRRILGEDGKVKYVRYSATEDETIRDQPEGLIDPMLRTLSFWKGDEAVAALHYYATHPMIYYGQGQVSCDFAGLARQVIQDGEPKVFQVYFNGCGGNVTAGKYNDGAKENRGVLRDRLVAAMKAAWKTTKTEALEGWEWRVERLALPARSEKTFGVEANREVLENAKERPKQRILAAFQLAWLERRATPIDLTCLDLGKAQVLHLPGEPFVEFQLAARQRKKDGFVCVAGYGDGGPWYIPTAAAYFEGGYEPSVAFVGPDSEKILLAAIDKLLQV